MISTTTSTNISNSVVQSTEQDSATAFNTYEMSLAAGTGSSYDGSGILALAGGDATAVGQNTLTLANASVQVSSGPASTEGLATTSLTAAAYSQNGTTYAGTSAYADLYGTADRTFWSSFSETSSAYASTSVGTSSSAVSTSTAQAYALDIGSLSSSPSPPAISPNTTPSHLDSLSPGFDLNGDCGCGDFDFILDGNVALADIDVAAYGYDTLAEVDLFALALDDYLSTVTFTALAAAA